MSNDEALKILGLEGGESLEQIRRAFRKKAMQYHPDRYQTFSKQAWATQRFIKVKSAYDFLMNSNTFSKESTTTSFAYESSYDQNQDQPDYSKDDSNKAFSLFNWIVDECHDIVDGFMCHDIVDNHMFNVIDNRALRPGFCPGRVSVFVL